MDASFQLVASIVLAGLAATYLVGRYLYRRKRTSGCSSYAANRTRKTMIGTRRAPSDS